MKKIALLAAAAASIIAVPAMAQEFDRSEHFNGGYISVVGGKSMQSNGGGERLTFTSPDGPILTLPDNEPLNLGFCNGAATSADPGNCAKDKDGAEYYARVGFDKRSGNFVIGALLEGGRNESIDYVSAFDGLDSYTMSRKSLWNAGARLRAGFTPDGGALFYVTGGGAYARLRNDFVTTNAVNPVTASGKNNAWGWAAGGGAEVMLADNLSLGLEYLYTDMKDKNGNANLGEATAPNLGQLVVGAGGVDVQRSSDRFRNHAVRGTVNFRF